MVKQHHKLNGHEFEQTPGDSEGQGSLACCTPWGCKESDTTYRLNNNNIARMKLKKHTKYSYNIIWNKLCHQSWLLLLIFFGIFFNLTLFYIGVMLIYNIVLVSGVQQGDSVMHIHISLLFCNLFPYRLLQNIECLHYYRTIQHWLLQDNSNCLNLNFSTYPSRWP